MEKNIKMSLEAARRFYKDGDQDTKMWLLENFTKEELEPKKGFTWEESFNGDGFFINPDSDIGDLIELEIADFNKNIFLTKKHAKSALAFAQLSHICARYNEGKERGAEVYAVHGSTINGLEVDTFGRFGHQLEFYSQESAQISAEVNRQLWLDYWMID